MLKHKTMITLLIIILSSLHLFAENQNTAFEGKYYLEIVEKIQSGKNLLYTEPYIASEIFENCIELSKIHKEDSLFYLSRKLYAISFSIRNQLDSALVLSKILVNDFPKNKYYKTQTSLYNFLGSLYGRNHDLDQALKYLLISDSLAPFSQSQELMLSIKNNIANVYLQNQEIQNALSFYKSALEVTNTQQLDKSTIWTLTNNIILCYSHLQELDSARAYFYDLLPLKNSEEINKSESILHFAFAFEQKGQLDSALYYISMSYDSLQTVNKSTKVRIDITKALVLLQKTREARYADTIQLKMKDPNFSEIPLVPFGLYDEIYHFFEEEEKYKEAFIYYQKYVALKDSIQAKSNSAKIKSIEFNLKYQKLLNQVDLQNEHMSKQDARELLLYVIVISLFILIIIIVTIGIYRKKIISVLAEQKEEITNQYDMLEEKNNQLESQNIEIESIVKDLKENKNRLENLNKQKDTFVSIFTHQLTNQVQAILMSAEALHLGKNKSEEIVEKFSEILYHASNHLRNMLSNLMEWSRTQSEYVKTSPVNFELQEIIDRNISSNKQAINKKQIQIVKVCKEQIVFADKAMIDTVFKNIISNAVKYSYDEGKIEFSCSIENNFIVSRVKDYGTGIKHELLEKLFNIETRVATKGTMGEQGSGLGLAICKELLALNSGKIEIETEEGKGTLVKISLPIPDKL